MRSWTENLDGSVAFGAAFEHGTESTPLTATAFQVGVGNKGLSQLGDDVGNPSGGPLHVIESRRGRVTFSRRYRYCLHLGREFTSVERPQQCVKVELCLRSPQSTRFPIDKSDVAVVAEHGVDQAAEGHARSWFDLDGLLNGLNPISREDLETLVDVADLVNDAIQPTRRQSKSTDLLVQTTPAYLLATHLVELGIGNGTLVQVAGEYSVRQTTSKGPDRVRRVKTAQASERRLRASQIRDVGRGRQHDGFSWGDPGEEDHGRRSYPHKTVRELRSAVDSPASATRRQFLIMSRRLRLLLIAIPAAVVLLPVTAFALNQAVTAGEVVKGVSVLGIDLGGLGEVDAIAELRAYENELHKPARFLINSTDVSVLPAGIGVELDEQVLVDQAMKQHRAGGFFSRMFAWLGGRDEVAVPASITVDDDALHAVFDAWEVEALDDPPFQGGIRVEDGVAVPEHPREGEGIDRESASDLVGVSVRRTERTVVTLPTRILVPELTNEDIDEAVVLANRIIGSPVTLTSVDPLVEIVFEPEDLVLAFRAEVSQNSPASIHLDLSKDVIASMVLPLRPAVEQPPRDAEFAFDEESDAYMILPSRSQTLLDVDLVHQTVYDASLTPAGVAIFPFAEGEPAAFTTEDAEAMGPILRVSDFTTKHSCCAGRVKNIHLMADAVDGAIVGPGEEFSLNGYVGQRTREKGYVLGGMLEGGKLIEAVGGGVSQFATTIYNAVFYGCYEDVEHKPHSIYFRRYPEVNEATVSWPTPQLIFRNDSDAVLIIRTEYTGTSITVIFYGNTGGKTCERELGRRHSYTNPATEFVKDPTVIPGTEVIESNGAQGWSNSVKRIITYPDGTVEEQDFTWRYRSSPKIIRIHPCDAEESEVVCPALVPPLIGLSLGDAKSAATALGLTVSQSGTVETDQIERDGLVATQSPGEGTLLELGGTISVVIYNYVVEPEG